VRAVLLYLYQPEYHEAAEKSTEFSRKNFVLALKIGYILIEDVLTKNNIHFVSSNGFKTSNTIVKLNMLSDIVILYETSKFEYASEGFASNEKAFADLL
jgi:hypothetical protein